MLNPFSTASVIYIQYFRYDSSRCFTFNNSCKLYCMLDIASRVEDGKRTAAVITF